jgi:hypothetical protein
MPVDKVLVIIFLNNGNDALYSTFIVDIETTVVIWLDLVALHDNLAVFVREMDANIVRLILKPHQRAFSHLLCVYCHQVMLQHIF